MTVSSSSHEDVSAQNTCTIDEPAHDSLTANGVQARLAVSKIHFFGHQYEVPAGSGTSSLFFTDIMLGGLVDGQLRMMTADITEDQMWPGPLDESGNPPADCLQYNKVFKVSKADILEYEETGVANPALSEWPWQLGAPVQDGDGVAGNYDLSAGDRPLVEGDEKLWWVLNDVGGIASPDRIPLAVEIQTSAFAVASDDPLLHYATFYRYGITYRGEAPLTDAYFGMHVFPDLGYSTDNYLGSDTTLGLGYVYNGDDFDENTRFFPGYGDRPPAVGLTIVEGIVVDSDGEDNDRDGVVDEPGERLPMTNLVDWTSWEPQKPEDYYGYLRGIWPDGQHFTQGGGGRSFSETEADFMYPGEPGTFWSEENVDDQGFRNTPADRPFTWSTGPFSISGGESREIVIAILWARGESRFDSVRLLKQGVPKIRELYASGFVTTHVDVPTDRMTETPTTLSMQPPYPNPAAALAHFELGLPQTGRVTLTAYDLLGRRVAHIADEPMAPGWTTVDWNTDTVSNGVYVVRLESGAAAVSKKVVVMK